MQVKVEVEVKVKVEDKVEVEVEDKVEAKVKWISDLVRPPHHINK